MWKKFLKDKGLQNCWQTLNKKAALKMTPNCPDAEEDAYGFSKSSSMPWMSRI